MNYSVWISELQAEKKEKKGRKKAQKKAMTYIYVIPSLRLW